MSQQKKSISQFVVRHAGKNILQAQQPATPGSGNRQEVSKVVEPGTNQEDKQDHPAITHVLNFMKFSNSFSKQAVTAMRQHTKAISGKRSARMMYGINLDIIPDRMRVNLRVATAVARASAAGPYNIEFTPSSLVDPFASADDSQPTGFDQWMNFYNQYIVMRSRTRIMPSSASSLPMVIAFGNQTFSGTGAFSRYAAHPRAWSTFYQGTGSVPTELTSSWVSHAEVSGLSENEFRANDSYWGTLNVAPTNNVILCYYVQAAGSDGTTTAFALDYTIVMEFEVEFFDRVDLGPS